MADEISLSGVALPGDPVVAEEAASKNYVDSGRIGAVLGGRQSANQTVTSSTTLVNSSSLSINLPAGPSRWGVDGIIYYQAAAASDIRLAWTLPTGASSGWHVLGMSTATTTTTGAMNPWTSPAMTSALLLGGVDSTFLTAWFRGYIVMSSTAGVATLQFAQGTSGTTGTILANGSYALLTRML